MISQVTFLLFGLFVLVFGSHCHHGGDGIKIYYELFVGDIVEEEHHIHLRVPPNTTFYQVMGQAAQDDSNYIFTATEFHGLGHYINSIGGTEQDRILNKYWMIYILNSPPNKNSPPSDSYLSPVGVDSIIVEEGKHYLFWYRTVNLSTHT